MNDPRISSGFPPAPSAPPPADAADFDRAAFELAPVGIVHVSLDGRRLRVNPRFCEMLGFPADDLLMQDFVEQIHPEDRIGIAGNRARLIAGEIPSYAMPRRYRRADGGWLWTITSVSLARGTDGRPAFLVTVIEDISERRRTEERLAGTQAMLSAVFENAAVGIEVLSLDGRRLRVNETLCRLTGYREDELLARAPADDLHPDDALLADRERSRLLAGEVERCAFERRYRHRQGHWVWTRVALSRVGGTGEGSDYTIAVVEDLTDRRIAEEAYARSQAMLLGMFEVAAVGMVITDIAGRRLRVNRTFCAYLGATEAELLAQTFRDQIHPDDAPRVEAERARLLAGEIPYYSLVRRLRHRDGHWVSLKTTVSLVRDAQGRPRHTIGVSDDISERERAQEALRASEAMLRGLFDHAGVGMLVIDPEGRRLRVNRAFCAMTGYSEDELLRQSARQALHPDDVEPALALRHRLVAGELPSYVVERRYRRRDGSWLWTRVTVSMIRDASDRPLHAVAIVEDIDALRQGAERLRESEARYRTMIEGIGVGIALMTPEGQRIEVNRALAEILGYSEQELLAMPYGAMAHPDELDAFSERRRRLIAGEIPSFSMERRYRRGDGSWIWCSVAVTLVRDAQDRPRYTLAAVRDVSARRAAQQKLEASETRFRKLLELSSDWYWEQDEQLRFTELAGNLRAEDELQLRQFLGLTRWEVPWHEVDPGVWEEHRRVLEARKPFRNLVLRRRDAQGRLRWISVNGEPVFDEDGTFRGYRGVSSDVTADREAAEALRASEAKASALAEIVNQSSDAIITKDLDDVIRTWNRGAERLFGYPAEEAIGRNAGDLLGVRGSDEDAERRTEALRQGIAEVRIARQRTRDGRLLDVEIAFSPLTDADGRLSGQIAMVRDISERMEFERALRESEARNRLLALVFKQTSDAIAIKDLDNVLVAWNPAAEALYGYAADEALGRNMTRLTQPECPETLVEACVSELRAQQTRSWRGVERTRGGEEIVVDATLSPLYDEHGRHIGEIGIARNITEQVRAERQLRESEARNRLLAATVEQSSEAIVTKDLDNTVLTWNRGAETLFGYPAEEAVGRNYTFLTHPRPEPEAIANGIARVRRGEARTWRNARRRKDGTLITLDVSVSPLHDEQGRHVGEISVGRDVTERVRAEEALRASERRNRELALIVDQSRDAIVAKDLDNRITTWNRGATALLGLEPGEAIGRPYPEVLSPGATDDEIAADLARLRRAQPATWETERSAPDGQILHLEVSVAPLYEPGGRHIGEVAVMRDVTARKRAERTLREQQLLLEQAQSIGRIGSWSLQLVGSRTLTWSREMFRIFGVEERAFGAQDADFLALVHPEDLPRVRAAVDGAIEDGQSYSVELRIVRPDGEQRWINERATVERDAAGRALRLIGVSQDITERKLAEQRIEFLATRDPLTELPNRLLLHERIAQGMASADRHGTQLALLFIDLDRFKTINDSLGHRVGDLMLQHVAARLRRCVRKEDTLARLGGDEFMVILDGLRDSAAAAQVARKILRLLARPYPIEGHQLNTSCSVGISLYPADGRDVQTLMKNADTAMYHAKERGRNNYQYFSADLNARVVERLSIENALRRALDRGEFSLVYQPQVRLASSRVVGAEALLRWNSPDRGPQSPGRFIGVAEESGLIEPIGEWVLHQACEQGARWMKAGYGDLRLAVNVSVRQLTRGFARIVARALDATGFDPRRLELEVTESLLMQHADETIGILKRIRELGVQFAVDDFGIGYSSLSYLKRFPIDSLKIDRTFIRDIASDTDDAAITSAVTAIGHSMGLRVCAEGVETKDQLRMLRVMNCDEYQGYLFSRPIDPDELTERFLAPKLI